MCKFFHAEFPLLSIGQCVSGPLQIKFTVPWHLTDQWHCQCEGSKCLKDQRETLSCHNSRGNSDNCVDSHKWSCQATGRDGIAIIHPKGTASHIICSVSCTFSGSKCLQEPIQFFVRSYLHTKNEGPTGSIQACMQRCCESQCFGARTITTAVSTARLV